MNPEPSIFEFRELIFEAPEQAERLKSLTVREKGFYKWFEVTQIQSCENVYHVWRLETFYYCECKFWEEKHKACKHILKAAPAYCGCGKPVEMHGAKCESCEQSTAIYLKKGIDRNAERIGGIRI